VDEWTCGACGGTNGPNDPYCTTCQARRLKGRAAGGAPAEPGWQCGDCETVNVAGAATCLACGAPSSRAAAAAPAATIAAVTTVVERTAEDKPSATPRPAGTAAARGGSGAADLRRDPTAARARRNMWIAIGSAAAVVLLACIGIFVALAAKHSPPRTSAVLTSPAPSAVTVPPTDTAPTPTQTTIPPGVPEAEAIYNQIIVPSEQAKSNIQSTIDDVDNCGNPAGDSSTFSQAAQTRQQLASTLQGLDVADIPQGQGLETALYNALTASATADNDYSSWASDEANGNCTNDDTSDANYQQALQDDMPATADKNSFLSLWNGLPSQYSLPQLTAAQF
jgi:hypothetical protein